VRVWPGPEFYGWCRLPSFFRLDLEAPFRPMAHRGDRYRTFSFWCTTKLREAEVSDKSKSKAGERDPQPQLKQNSVLHGHFIRLYPWVCSTTA